ncbi:QWRF motif-containing protein 3 [Vigna radiata var. radiata]|uniref:QWRF motif-containing protein 3 n=1 Tax=Vigna radiata var. radiata TaxID=3916 RepID=A0A1S3UZR6_VIGRR|nr:QWRF motif-containing protein 3 [Vigna radiata var. radiata]
MKTPNGSPVSSPSPKLRQLRTRESSSRFLPSPPNSTTHSAECHSPVRRKSSSPNRRHAITEDPGPTRHQLWPSSAVAKRNSGTLADHITEDRIIEGTTNRPISIGGSARHVAKLATPSESPSSKRPVYSNMAPGRLLLDENAKSFSSRRHSCSSRNSIDSEHDAGKTTPIKTDMEVVHSSVATTTLRRPRRGTSDSNIANMDGDSSAVKRFTLKTAIRRANSLAGSYKSSKSSWALSPGRAESPAMSVESMDRPMSFSGFKHHPTSPTTKVKGVEKLLNMGFDLFKSKKSGGFGSLSPIGFGVSSEVVHKLRLFDNRLMQWRFANARAQVVDGTISHKAESKLICVWDALTKLQRSVLKKKIQFVREKLEMKVAFVLYSQMKLLESWVGMERQHLQAITAIKECLHSVVCRVPLLEGAKVNMQSTSIALRHATDLTTRIKSILTTLSSSEVDNITATLSELAKVVAQEKQLLEEFYDIFRTIYVFEGSGFSIVSPPLALGLAVLVVLYRGRFGVRFRCR